MDVDRLVVDHYSGANLAAVITDAFAAEGIAPDDLTPALLSAVDQLHAGFAPATAFLLDRLEIGPHTRLLDIGCGIGGACRMAAERGAGRVAGVDLSPELVAAAERLTELVGLSGTVEFRAASGAAIPLPDASFDTATLIHAGMNIPDKTTVFFEVRRLLETGGQFGLFEQMRTGDGPLPYPLPWAVDERSSFVETADAYAAQLGAAGFSVESTLVRTAETSGPPPAQAPTLSPAVIFGPEFRARLDNNIVATRAGDLGAVVILARAT